MMRPSLRRDVALLLGLGLGVAVAACPLPSTVRYKCEPDGTCAQKDYRCGLDGYCYAGECTPRDATEACAQVECGLVSDGCGAFVDCQKWCPTGLECGVTTPNLCGTPQLCTAAGWCWENPLPQGAGLYAAYRADARHTWFVGEMGTVLFFDGEKSRLETMPGDDQPTFFGVHGTGSNDVYVVGTGGLIFHFDGTAWTKEGLGTGVPATLRSVVALPGGRAVVVGAGGRALFREPAAPVERRWRDSLSGTTEELMDVVVLSDGGVRALSFNGLLLEMRADQLSWTPAPVARTGFASSSTTGARTLAVRRDRLYAGGTPSYPLYIGVQRLEEDGGWEAISDAGRDVYDLFGTEDELWAVGTWVVERFGADDVPLPQLGGPPGTPTFGFGTVPWRAGVVLRPNEALVGGRSGVMAVAQPAVPQLLMRSRGSLRDVNAVCGSAPLAMYGAGRADRNTSCGGGCRPDILERTQAPDGTSWRVTSGPALGNTESLLACYSGGPNQVWLLGDDSKFYVQNGTTWSTGDFGPSGLTGRYIAGWGTPSAGYIFLRNNTPTLTESANGLDTFVETFVPGPALPLYGVWGMDATDKVLVGAGGVVLRWVNDRWSDPPLSTGFTDDLLTVHGAQLAAGGQRYVAAGTGGRVFTLDTGDVTSTTSLGPSLRLTGSWVSTSGAVWVAGYLDQSQAPDDAFIARQAPGGTFERMRFWGDRELRGLYGLDLPDGGTTVWVSGEDGLILRHDEP